MKAFPSNHDPKTGTMRLGMEMRDYFAARAMQAIVSHDTYEFSEEGYKRSAKAAYAIADAMMEARDE